MRLPSVSGVTYGTYIILVVTALAFWSKVYVETINVLLAFDVHRQTPVRIHYTSGDAKTESFIVSFEAEHHYAPSGQLQIANANEKISGKMVLWHQEIVDFDFLAASQRIFSMHSLSESMNHEQISICNGYVFRKPFPKPCRTAVLRHVKCSGPMPTCATDMCLKKDCDEPSTHVTFGFDAHIDTHLIPVHWAMQHDLHVQFKNDDGTFTNILLDTSDATQVGDAEATLSLSKLKAPFSINGTTLSLHDGVKEDSDMEAIAYSVVSALLFSIWVYSTGTSSSTNRGNESSRMGISDIFIDGQTVIGKLAINNELLASLLRNLKSLKLTIIFNSSLSICVASIVAICYEIVNDTVYTFLGAELATIFTNDVQLTIVILYTALGCVPFMLTGPILVGMMDLKKYKFVKDRAVSVTGFKHGAKAYLLVALRLCFEIQLISAFQIHIPPSAGIPFQNVVSFALGITLLVVIGRDVTILYYDRQNCGTAYANLIIWLTVVFTLMYSTLAMTTPFLWSTQIANHKDILPLSTAITSVAVLLGSILFSNRFSKNTKGDQTERLEMPVFPEKEAARQPIF